MSTVLIEPATIQNFLLVKNEDFFRLNFGSVLKKISDDDFLELCRENEDLEIEMTQNGDLEIMSGTGGRTGRRNSRVTRRVDEWAEKDGSGVCFDSSTTFTLPNGAKRSPDTSWVIFSRWNTLSGDEQDGLPPLCPDFVIEIRSRTDSLKKLQTKMAEYLENGAQLGWLIDSQNKQVFVYRPNAAPEVLENPIKVSGEPLLNGFSLNLQEIWD